MTETTADDGLIFAARGVWGPGPVERVGWADLAAGPAGCWVHAERTHPATAGWLRTRSGLPEIAADAMLEQDTRPRVARFGEAILLNLRGPNPVQNVKRMDDPADDSDDPLIAVRCWFTADAVITTRKYPFTSIMSLVAQVDCGRGPRRPGELLAAIVEGVTDQLAPVIEELADESYELDDALETGRWNERYARRLRWMRQLATIYRRYLGPQRDAIARLAVEPAPWITDADRAVLREQVERLGRMVDDADNVRETSISLVDHLAAMASERTNRAAARLATVATLTAPLTVISGFLGMNVAGIPGSEHPWAFPTVVACSALLTTALLVFFRRRKWL